MVASWIWLWCVGAALAAVTIARRWRPVLGRRLIGRSHTRHLSVRVDGTLRAGPWRLCLYGVAPLDCELAVACLRQAVADGRVRLRVLHLDRADRNALVVVLRCNGIDPARTLLRQGLAVTRGTGARFYRQAQSAAAAERLGLWRRLDAPPPGRDRAAGMPPSLVFPWWQM